MGWFYNMKVLWKLVSGFSVVCAIMALVGWMGVSKTAKTNELLNSMFQRELIGISECKEANILLVKLGRAVRGALLTTEQSEVQSLQSQIVELEAELEKNLDETAETITSEEDKELLTRIRIGYADFKAATNQCILLRLSGDTTGALALMNSNAERANELDAAMTEIAVKKIQQAEEASQLGKSIYLGSRNMIFFLTGCGLVVGLLLGFFIAKVVSLPMIAAVKVLQAVAAGDFTARLPVNTSDEIGQMGHALNNAVESVQKALQETRGVADSVATAAQQLSSASEEISSGAQEQASGLEETASSLEEITSTVKQNADNAQQANQLAVSAKEVAERGGRIVSEAVRGMSEINSSSKKIADIITTIDEIAFQTNLLALNAAVEAARAGEQGRGFAVVASEVRNLAQRSAGAAKEIKLLIQDSVAKVSNGSELVNQSGEALEQIVSSVKRVTDIVSEIAAASREQTRGVEQVNKAVTQMDTVTQSNASQTEELSSTAESLATQAEQLQRLVAKFKLESHSSAVAAVTDAKNRSSSSSQTQASTVKSVSRISPSRQENGSSNGFQDAEGGELATVGANSGDQFEGFEEF